MDIGDIKGTLTLDDKLTAVLLHAMDKMKKEFDQVKAQQKTVQHEVNTTGAAVKQFGTTIDNDISRAIIKFNTLKDSGEKLAGMIGQLPPQALLAVGAVAALAAGLVVLKVAYEGVQFVIEAVRDGMEIQDTVTQLENSLRNNGSAAGYTSNQMLALADSLVVLTGREDEEIAKGLLIFSRFKELGHDILPEATRAAIDLAQASKKDLAEGFTTVARLLEGDTRAYSGLKDMGVILDAQQKKNLITMHESGKVAEYQAIVMDILRQNVGGAAEAYGHTLAGQISIAKAVLSEFGEALSSEVIPALEDVISTLVESLGGWEEVKRVVTIVGTAIGEEIREIVYGLAIWYHETLRDQDLMSAAWIDFYKFWLDITLGSVTKFSEFMGLIPGYMGEPYREAAKIAKELNADIDASLTKSYVGYVTSAAVHQKALDDLAIGINQHRKALEGTDKIYDDVIDQTDRISKANGELAQKIGELIEKQLLATNLARKKAEAEAFGGHVLREVTLREEAHAKAVAAAQGLEKASAEVKRQIADALEVLIIGESNWNAAALRNRTLLAGTLALEREYSAALAKLREIRDGSTSATRKALASEEAFNLAFSQGMENIPGYVEDLARLNLLRLDSAEALKVEIAQVSEAKQSDQEYANLQVQLLDLTQRSIDASEEFATQQEIENRIISEGARGNQVLIDIINIDVKSRRARLNVVNAEIVAARAYNDLISAQESAAARSNNPDPRARAIEDDFTDYLARLGDGSIAEGKRIFDAWAEEFGHTVEEIKAKLGQIQDVRIADSARGAGTSGLAQFQQERDTYTRLINEGVISARDGAAKINQITEDMWSTQLGNWTTVLDDLGQTFGGFFAELAKGAQILQSAAQTYSDIKNAVTNAGGSEDWGKTFGEIGAWFQIFKGIYDVWKKGLDEKTIRKYDEAAVITFSDGEFDLLGRSNRLEQQIRQVAEQFAEAIGGTISGFADLEIQVRKDGKYFKAFVAGEFLGKFESIEEAMRAALAAAFADPKTTFRGITKLVQEALNEISIGEGIGGDAGALQDWLTQIKEVAELNWSDGTKQVAAAIINLDGLRSALSELNNITPATIQGFQNLSQAEVNAWQSADDALSGRQRTAEEDLLIRQQEGRLLAANLQLRKADVAMMIVEAKARFAILQANQGGNRGDSGPEPNPNKGTGRGTTGPAVHGILAYSTAIVSSGQAALTVAGVMGAAVNTELAAAAAQLNALIELQKALDAIVLVDPANYIPRGGGSNRGGGDDKKDRQRSIRDQIAELGLNDIQKVFFDTAIWLRDLEKAIRDAGYSAAETAELIAKAREEAERRRREEIERLKATDIKPYLGKDTAGGRSEWAQQLEEMKKEYDKLRETHKETGIALWKINQAERERMRLMGIEIQASLGIAKARIYQELIQTAQSLNFLKQHAAELGLTAQDVADIMQEVSTNKFIDIAEGMNSVIKDAKLSAELDQIKYKMQKANWLLEIEMAKSKGVLLQAEYDRLKQIWGTLPDQLPANDNGPNTHDQLQELFAQRMQEAAQAIKDAARAWDESTKKLIDYQKSALLSNLSPLNSEQRLAEARRQYEQNLRAAESGDVNARNNFDQYRNALLEALRVRYKSGAPYATEFQNTQADLQRLIIMPRPGSEAQNPYTQAFTIASQPIVAGLKPDSPIAKGVGETTTEVKKSGEKIEGGILKLRDEHGNKLDSIKDAIKGTGTKDDILKGRMERMIDLMTQLLRKAA